MAGSVVAVARDGGHRFSKTVVGEVRLVEGLGVEGDAHSGVTVRHRSRVAVDPTQPNLRQVHLIGAELFDDLAERGFAVGPADLGENITTQGINLLAMPEGAVLCLGPEARVRVTGLRNPCAQIEAFRAGLLTQVLEHLPEGRVLRKTGVMGVVVAGGAVRAGDQVTVMLPEGVHRPLQKV